MRVTMFLARAVSLAMAAGESSDDAIGEESKVTEQRDESN